MFQPATAPDRMREIYNIVRQRQPKIFGEYKLMVPGQLRCETSINAAFNQITFNVLENQGAVNGTERRLKLTDNFIITSIGFFPMKVEGAAPVPTQAEIAAGIMRTWANPTIFAKAGEAAAIQGIYGGKWRITVNKDVFIDDAVMNIFRRVPVSQEDGTIQMDGYDNMNYGYIPMTPTIGFSGIGDNNVTITLPASLDLSGDTNEVNYMVAVFNGFNVINANVGRI